MPFFLCSPISWLRLFLCLFFLFSFFSNASDPWQEVAVKAKKTGLGYFVRGYKNGEIISVDSPLAVAREYFESYGECPSERRIGDGSEWILIADLGVREQKNTVVTRLETLYVNFLLRGSVDMQDGEIHHGRLHRGTHRITKLLNTDFLTLARLMPIHITPKVHTFSWINSTIAIDLR